MRKEELTMVPTMLEEMQNKLSEENESVNIKK